MDGLGCRLLEGQTDPRRPCHNAQIDWPLALEKLTRGSDHLGALEVRVEAGNVSNNCPVTWREWTEQRDRLLGFAGTGEVTADLGPESHSC